MQLLILYYKICPCVGRTKMSFACLEFVMPRMLEIWEVINVWLLPERLQYFCDLRSKFLGTRNIGKFNLQNIRNFEIRKKRPRAYKQNYKQSPHSCFITCRSEESL